MRIQSVLLIK